MENECLHNIGKPILLRSWLQTLKNCAISLTLKSYCVHILSLDRLTDMRDCFVALLR
jgi:thiaminase